MKRNQIRTPGVADAMAAMDAALDALEARRLEDLTDAELGESVVETFRLLERMDRQLHRVRQRLARETAR